MNHFEQSFDKRIKPSTFSPGPKRDKVLFTVDELIVPFHQRPQFLAIVLVSTFKKALHAEMISIGRFVQGYHLLGLEQDLP